MSDQNLAPSLVSSPARCPKCGSGFHSQLPAMSDRCSACGATLVSIVGVEVHDMNDLYARMAETDA